MRDLQAVLARAQAGAQALPAFQVMWKAYWLCRSRLLADIGLFTLEQPAFKLLIYNFDLPHHRDRACAAERFFKLHSWVHYRSTKSASGGGAGRRGLGG